MVGFASAHWHATRISRIMGAAGERVIPLIELHRLPANHPELETTLEPGELMTAVEVPPLSFGARSLYVKVRDRASFAFALVSVAVAVDVADGSVRDARIALGGVGTKPWRAHEAEDALRGRLATVESYRVAAEAAMAGAVQRGHQGCKN